MVYSLEDAGIEIDRTYFKLIEDEESDRGEHCVTDLREVLDSLESHARDRRP
jgi:hypothetical protein